MPDGPYGSDEPYRASALSPALGGRLARAWRRPARPLPRAPRTGTRIAGLAVSNSDTVLTQAEVLDRLGLAGDEFAEGIFSRSGVKRRHLQLSPDFLARTLQDRTGQVEEELLSHAIKAVDELGIDLDQVGTVMSASLYSLGVPTLAHRLIEHYGLRASTDKYHLTGIACASGVPLMRLAAQTLYEHPDRHTLVVAADSMSSILMPATPHDARAKTVGSALFGDGCAAALLSRRAGADGPLIVGSQVHQIGETLDAVALKLAAQDSYLHIARELPDLASAGLAGVVGDFLASHELAREDISHWMLHPGGRRIIENVRDALELSDVDVATSWTALADHGNVGTPSIMYVLADTIAHDKPRRGERGMLVTIGPGVTVGLMLLQW